jgi:C-terminal processing protease CtpA/Prc
VVADRDRSDWTGSISALVGGATAGAGEAVAELVRAAGGQVYGETTYGLGAEAKLYELENGCGLLISAELWETASGSVWNAEGVEPDRVVQGKGRELDEMRADQLAQVLQLLELGAGASPKDGDAPAEAA